MPSVIVADGMSRKIVLHCVFAASAVRHNMVRLPIVGANGSTTDVATTSCFAQHIAALCSCERRSENTFFAARINSAPALHAKLAQCCGEGTNIRENLICRHCGNLRRSGGITEHRAGSLRRARRVLLRSFPSLQYVHDVSHLPKPLRDTSGHSGRDPQGLMYADKVVIHEVQRDGVSVVLDLF